MTDRDIQLLIDRYLAGETSPDEERLLATALLRDDLPEDWLLVRTMLGELAMGEAAYDILLAQKRSSNQSNALPLCRRRILPGAWAAAACIALVAGVGYLLFRQSPSRPTEQNQSLSTEQNQPQPAAQPMASAPTPEHAQSQRPTHLGVQHHAPKRRRPHAQSFSSGPLGVQLSTPEPLPEDLLPADLNRHSYEVFEQQLQDVRERGARLEARIMALM